MLCAHAQNLRLRPANGFATGTALRHQNSVRCCRSAALPVQARYRGINTDRSKVEQFRRDGSDTGSSEVQIAQLSARVTQLTTHLQKNKKDHSTTRGLLKILSRRKSLMEYLKNTNRQSYENIVQTLGIRPLKEVIN